MPPNAPSSPSSADDAYSPDPDPDTTTAWARAGGRVGAKPARRPDALFDRATQLFASCAAGLESLLVDELRSLGLDAVRQAGAGASFAGGLEAGYRACLHSFVANRVLLPLHAGAAATPEALYERTREIDWSSHLAVDGTLAVDFFTAKSAITHSQYGALKIKDAIVDQFREQHGRRPDVERDTPDVRVNGYLYRDRVRLAIDLSGTSLHRRGYRDGGGPAPIKENLAAALLLAAGWPERLEAGETLADPMCGSGTILIEAAMMACRRAPGLGRDHFGFLGWQGHDAALWERLVSDARKVIRPSPVVIAGGDRVAAAVESARRHARRACVADAIAVETLAIAEGRPAALEGAPRGLVLTNPPYGERLAADPAFHSDFGAALATHYDGWQLGIITASTTPVSLLRLPLERRFDVRNGGIDCVFLEGRVPAWKVARKRQPGAAGVESVTSVTHATARHGAERGGAGSEEAEPEVAELGEAEPGEAEFKETEVRGSGTGKAEWRNHEGGRVESGRAAPEAVERAALAASTTRVDIVPFANRLGKNMRSLKGWLRQADVRAWRVYDAELPDFSMAIDVYDTRPGARHLVVQEYRAPATVNAMLAEARLQAVVESLPELLGTDAERVHVKVRERQSGTQQYDRATERLGVVDVLEERGARYELNFSDYLDTGLFLDHRKVRRHIGDVASGKRFLNLFAYTGAATVAAIIGGARQSVSVDLSNRYCQWAERNLALNEADPSAHVVIRRDVSTWLAEASREERFDVILLDPPTFSNSTGTERDWSVQADHVAMIDACLERLNDDGTLIFSNNFRRFRMDPGLEAGRIGDRALFVEERSRWSLARDFARNPRMHRVWFIRHAPASH